MGERGYKETKGITRDIISEGGATKRGATWRTTEGVLLHEVPPSVGPT